MTPGTNDSAPFHPRALGYLVADSRFEIVPMKGVDEAMTTLPPGSRVAVTASPRQGLDATAELTEHLAVRGHRPVPHLAARMVRSRDHLASLLERLTAVGVDDVFVIAGDAQEPAGPYEGAADLLADILSIDIELPSIGIAAYPDGHPLISEADLVNALRTKQAMLFEAGRSAYAATQMCFDPTHILAWLGREREMGLRLPVVLGLPGVVARRRLLTMAVRLGVGASVRYLRKQPATVGRLIGPQGFDPLELLAPIAARAEELSIQGIHLFTFNQVATTAAWLDDLRRSFTD